MTILIKVQGIRGNLVSTPLPVMFGLGWEWVQLPNSVLRYTYLHICTVRCPRERGTGRLPTCHATSPIPKKENEHKWIRLPTLVLKDYCTVPLQSGILVYNYLVLSTFVDKLHFYYLYYQGIDKYGFLQHLLIFSMGPSSLKCTFHILHLQLCITVPT